MWIGLGWGGVMRRTQDGKFTTLDPAGLPDFARQPVRSIQLDRWSAGGRTVYFAFMPSTQGDAVLKAGGVAAYSGP